MNYDEIKAKLASIVDKYKVNKDQINFLKDKRELLELCKGDNYLISIIGSMDVNNIDYYFSKITDYINENINKKNVEELISKTFGIDISEIQHNVLNNGNEIFSFYDIKYGELRVLENPKDGQSLTEQLKEIQNENVMFQSQKDYKSNANEILKSEIKDFNCELSLIPINDIYKYEKIINNLQPKERRMFDYLIKSKDIQKIAYVNIENCFAVTEDKKIIEAFIMENTNEVKIESPREYSYNYNQMDNKENIDENISSNVNNEVNIEEANIDIPFDDVEDMGELVEAELQVNNRKVTKEELEQIKKNIVKYYKNPSEMTSLPGEQREFYEKMVKIYAEKIDEQKKNNVQNQMVYKKDEQGYNNILSLSIIVIIFCIILFIILK